MRSNIFLNAKYKSSTDFTKKLPSLLSNFLRLFQPFCSKNLLSYPLLVGGQRGRVNEQFHKLCRWNKRCYQKKTTWCFICYLCKNHSCLSGVFRVTGKGTCIRGGNGACLRRIGKRAGCGAWGRTCYRAEDIPLFNDLPQRRSLMGGGREQRICNQTFVIGKVVPQDTTMGLMAPSTTKKTIHQSHSAFHMIPWENQNI